MSFSNSIRRWAFKHARLAQGLIAIATILLFFLGHIMGVLADELGWDAYAIFLIGIGTAMLAWTLAPRKDENFPIRYTYARQKVAVVVMLTSVCIGIGGWAICIERMDFRPTQPQKNQLYEAAIGPHLSQNTIVSLVERGLSNWFHGGISKALLKKTRRFANKNFEISSSKKDTVLAAIVVYFVALLLAFLVAILSCALSCNGQVVLAILVALGGLLLVLAFIDGNLEKIKSGAPKKTRRKVKKHQPDL